MKNIFLKLFSSFLLFCFLLSSAQALDFNDLVLKTTLKAHRGSVTSLVRSPNGTQVAFSTASYVHVFDLASQKIVYSLVGHKGFVSSIAWSFNGKYLLTASYDATAKLWLAGTGKLLRSVTVTGGTDLNVARFAPDAKTFATGGDDKIVRVWDTQTGKLLRSLKGHTGIIQTLDFASNGKMLVSGDIAGGLRIWNLSGQLIKELKSDQTSVNQVGFSPDAKTLVSLGDKTVNLWTVAKWTVQSIPNKTDSSMIGFSWSPNGKTIALVATGSVVRLLDFEHKNSFSLIGEHSDSAYTVIWLNPKTLISGGADGLARVWDVKSKKQLLEFSGFISRVKKMVFSPDGGLFATIANETDIQIWKSSDNTPLQTLKADFPAWQTTIAFNSTGSELVSGDDFGHVKLFNLATGSLKLDFNNDDRAISSISFTPDDKNVVYLDTVGKIGLLATSDFTPTDFDKASDDRGIGFVFSPDGLKLIVSHESGTIKILNFATGTLVESFNPSEAGINAMALNFNGDKIAIGTSSGTVKILDLKGQNLWSSQISSTELLVVQFSKDDLTLAVGGADGTLRLYDAVNGKVLFSLATFNDWIYAIAFNQDGTRLLVGTGTLNAGGTISIFGASDDRNIFKTEVVSPPKPGIGTDWSSLNFNKVFKLRYSSQYKVVGFNADKLELASLANPDAPNVLVQSFNLKNASSLLEDALFAAREKCALELITLCTDPITVATFNSTVGTLGYEIMFGPYTSLTGKASKFAPTLPLIALDARASNQNNFVLLSLKPNAKVNTQAASALLRDVANNIDFESL